MSFKFRWNVYADQPHNVALKKDRLPYHLKHTASYFGLLASNFRKTVPVLSRYRENRKKMHVEPVRIESPIALSVSPSEKRTEEVLELLRETGIHKTLVRIPSWESGKLDVFEKFFNLLLKHDIELTVALLQQRDDVFNPSRWQHFLDEVFSRFARTASFFEVGHAWNRTKWGVWSYKEYLKLALPAVSLAKKYSVKLVGPAVIDFEFHLYPPVLKAIPFNKVSSLLYVDRMGAPENLQYGWDTSRKVALLKAVVDGSCGGERDLWITEVNWPLKGTGKYSPASGKPNVSEEEQANYLVRYFILCLTSGFVERIYWWQLVAPGYGLIDSRKKKWRRRPSFYALKTMVSLLEGSTFTGKIPHSEALIFSFCKGKNNFVVCWTNGAPCEHVFTRRIMGILSRDGEEIPFKDERIGIDGSPKYVFIE
ncbi:MAG: hypothetical protein GTN73_04220 [Candidatus Aminicenantes bacterium]|nr:hypothetical protein [Candidatus Aminicenantes bacterium]